MATGGGGAAGGGSGGAGGQTSTPPPVTMSIPPNELPEPPWSEAGVGSCAPEFQNVAGQCRPTVSACANGTKADFDNGCVQVGVSQCSPAFVGADGFCHPRSNGCPDGTYPVPSLGCIPIDGAGCGEAPWGNIPDDPLNVYLDLNFFIDTGEGTVGGDGSRDAPFNDMYSALATVPEGGRLVLAEGYYQAPVVLDKGIEIVGRCPSLVTLSGVGSMNGYEVLVGVSGAVLPVSLQRLRISGPAIGLRVESAVVTLEDVWIQGAYTSAVQVVGDSTVTLTRTLVEDTNPMFDGTYGDGVLFVDGATGILNQVAIRKNRLRGVLAYDTSTFVSVSDSVVETTLPQESDGFVGQGIQVTGAEVYLSDVALGGNQRGLYAGDAAQVTMTRSLVEETAHPQGGTAVWAEGGAVVGLEGNLLLNNGPGVYASSAAQVTSVGNFIAFGQADGDVDCAGLAAEGGASVKSAGDVVYGNQGNGVRVGEGSTVGFNDGLIEGQTHSPAVGSFGLGVFVLPGGSVTLERSALVRNEYAGIWADGGDAGLPTSVSATQMLVEGTLPQGSAPFGMGIFGGRTTTVLLSDVFVDGGLGAGVFVFGGMAEVKRSVVTGVTKGSLSAPLAPNMVTDAADGVVVSGSEGTANILLEDCLLENNGRAGFVAHNAQGAMSRSTSRKNVFGVAVSGASKPELTDNNTISENTMSDIAAEGSVNVP